MVQVQKSETILLPWLRRMRANILSDLTDVSERLAQMIIIDIPY
jgi:hypothetical protein